MINKKKTKLEIAESFIKQARQGDLNKISVKSICDDVGIARQSFYYHFEDMNDLVEFCVDFANQDLSLKMINAQSIEEALTYFYRVIKENNDIIRKVFDSPFRLRNQDKFILLLRDYLQIAVSKQVIEPRISLDELDIYKTYHSLAILGSCLYAAYHDVDEKEFIRSLVDILTK